MKTPELSFLSGAEKLTLKAYQLPRTYSILASEVISRLVSAAFLSLGAALDLVFHSVLLLPTFVYAIGKSIYKGQSDFTLPWQHLQRVRNAVAPLLLGSFFGVLHPLAGLAMCEATDKHAVVGMLSSNVDSNLQTPCSPIHSLSIIEDIAKKHRYREQNDEKKEIFSEEHISALQSAKNLESSLEKLQAQEFIHKITNITLSVMAALYASIEDSALSDMSKAILVRISGLLIPLFIALDTALVLLLQTFFLITGAVRLISGRGPIYTEVTANPLMHLSLLTQNLLKSLGALTGMFVYFFSPMAGFNITLFPSNLFFKMQMNMILSKIKSKMHLIKNNERFAIPIVLGDDSILSAPTSSMHKTYLIVEKKDDEFHLYWVNRPKIALKQNLDIDTALDQIRSMLEERFPFMNMEKLMNYQAKGENPEFQGSINFATLAKQGGRSNCVVSNAFGMLEALDKIKDEEEATTQLRYQAVRESLMKNYEFYKDEFFPFVHKSEGYALSGIWEDIKQYPTAPI